MLKRIAGSTLKITHLKAFKENYDVHNSTNTYMYLQLVVCVYSDTVLYIHSQGSKILIQLSNGQNFFVLGQDNSLQKISPHLI